MGRNKTMHNEKKLGGKRRMTPRKRLGRVLLYVLMLLVAAMYLLPFLWMVSTSLKTPAQVFVNPPEWIPNPVQFGNYADAVHRIDYLRYTLNTLFVAVLSVLGSVISSSMVAYSLSKIRWALRGPIFAIVLATMMIPYQVTMIPLYIIWRNLGLMGSYWPLIIPCFLGGSYYVFLLRQFYMTIPDSLMEAATIDGANEGRIYVSILLPLIRPALTSVGVFTFLAAWSDFLGPLLYINRADMYTLSLGLYGYVSEHSVEWHLLMAASVIFVVPIVILFFFAQKQFIEGITVTGMKG